MSPPIPSHPVKTESQTDKVVDRFKKALRHPGGITICSLMLIVGGGWFSDALNGACIKLIHFQSCPESAMDWLGVMVSLVIFLLGAMGLALATQHYLPVQYLRMRRGASGRSGLIIAVSAPNGFEVSETGNEVKDKRLPDGHLSISGKIEQDIEGLGDHRLNIQQFLRAVRPHVGESLAQVSLLGSYGDGGSGKHLQAYSRVLHRYAPQAHIRIESHVDFEDVDAMYQAINGAVEYMTKEGNLSEKDIVIDVTGGQKIASIAASLTTLHKPELEFQYVSQNAANELLTFNIVSKSQARLNG